MNINMDDKAFTYNFDIIVNGIKLTDLVVPESITSIGKYSFYNCKSLESITFHSNVTTIVQNAFNGCYNVKKIVCQGNTPPVCGAKALEGISISNCALFVPQGSVDTYKAASPWSEFSNIVEEGTPIISMASAEATMNANETLQLTATSLIGGTITWTSSDESIATVSTNGVVTAKKAGNVVITATAEDGSTATCSIAITKVAQTITWEQTFENIYEGNEIALTAKASSEQPVEYAITNGSELAEIKNGKLVCKTAGEVTVEARQTGNDVYAAAESISKTITITKDTGIDNVSIEGVKVILDNGSITIVGTTIGQTVIVYNLCGAIVKSDKAIGEETTITGLQKGLTYIIKVGSNHFKIAM